MVLYNINLILISQVPFLWEMAAFVKKSDGKPLVFYQIMDAHIYNIYHPRVLENVCYYFINLKIFYQMKSFLIFIPPRKTFLVHIRSTKSNAES